MTGVCEHTHSPYTTPPILKPESSTAWENNLPEGSWMVESERWEENRHWHQIIIKTSPLRASVFLCKMRGLDWMGDRKYIFLTEHMLLERCGEKASEGRSCLNGNVYLSSEWCLPWKCGRRRMTSYVDVSVRGQNGDSGPHSPEFLSWITLKRTSRSDFLRFCKASG